MKKAILALFVAIASIAGVQAQLADGKYILDFNKRVAIRAIIATFCIYIQNLAMRSKK